MSLGGTGPTGPFREDWDRQREEENALVARIAAVTWNPATDEVCTWSIDRNGQIGGGCQHCGHTTFVHPDYRYNPSLTECVICVLLKMAHEMEVWAREAPGG